MTSLNLKAAFFHVIDAHRWLAASGCAWNVIGASARSEAKTEAHRLLPNIDVIVRDCLLLHARSLIKFYRAKGRGTDILLTDFGDLSISTRRQGDLEKDLVKYERPIEVHLLHLTDYRDPDYRNTHPTDPPTFRPDWNAEASMIVELLLESAKCVADQRSNWQQPFKDLYEATDGRYRVKSYCWPSTLGEKADVEKYLTSLGL